MTFNLDWVSVINTKTESVTMAANFVLCLHWIASNAEVLLLKLNLGAKPNH